jgi:hypothetical protein
LYNITRYRFLLKEDPHRTNYGMNEPLNGAIRVLYEFSDLFEFFGSRDGFRVRIARKECAKARVSDVHALSLGRNFF